MKRLESISRSPINANLSSSLQGTFHDVCSIHFEGLQTIRAFSIQESFQKKFDAAVNQNLKAFFIYYSVQRWLAFRLDMICSIITFATAIFGVVARNSISPSTFGLALSVVIPLFLFLMQKVLSTNGWSFPMDN